MTPDRINRSEWPKNVDYRVGQYGAEVKFSGKTPGFLRIKNYAAASKGFPMMALRTSQAVNSNYRIGGVIFRNSKSGLIGDPTQLTYGSTISERYKPVFNGDRIAYLTLDEIYTGQIVDPSTVIHPGDPEKGISPLLLADLYKVTRLSNLEFGIQTILDATNGESFWPDIDPGATFQRYINGAYGGLTMREISRDPVVRVMST